MKKWVFLFVLFLLFAREVNEYKSDGDFQIIDERHGLRVPKESGTLEIAKDQVYQGNLLLVNKEHPVHRGGIKSDVVNLFQHKELIEGYGLLDERIRLSQGVAEKFLKMVRAAEKDNVRHFMISSGYRNEEEQSQLYQEKGSAFALPAGYSEHNLGLSLDISSTLSGMNEAPEGRWLQKNASKYGFILRYPENKKAITGIEYEPWHFRYVGLPHSRIMQKKNFTLEEYLTYIKEKKKIGGTISGVEYEVSYYPVSSKKTVKVQANAYEVSGDNMGGVIVTAFSSVHARDGQEK
ncbi:M15 family metallopeptidase [Peribacillus simplex]|jgi:D-alanyl-D-alanine carboxypeptidase|uniref:M15 family metallopeptidase n=1 Tax=Peribacillus simplex TaxID=1478 RepID=UPI0032632960